MDGHDVPLPMDIDSNSDNPVAPLPSQRKAKAPKIAENTWESVKEKVYQLYVEQNQSLGQVMKNMYEVHGFEATKRQYENRISKWGFEKKVKTSEMTFITQKQQRRKLEEPEKRKLKFIVRGAAVTEDKISGFQRRNPGRAELGLSSTPPDVSYHTASDSCPSGSSHSSHSSPSAPSPALSTDSTLTVLLGQSPPPETPMLAPAQDPQPPASPEYAIRQKLADNESLWGPTAPATLACLEELGDFLHSQGRYKSADEVFRRLAKIQKSEKGMESEEVVRVIQKLGDTLLCQGHVLDAGKLLQKAHQISEQLTGEPSSLTLGCLGSLARVKLALGCFEEAIALHTEALHTSTRVHGERHIETLVYLLGVADVSRAMGRFDEAKSLYRRLLEMDPDRDSSFPSIQALTGLAVIHSLRGQFEEATELHTQALNKAQTIRGSQHPSSLGRGDDLAAVYSVSGRLHEAETLCAGVFEEKVRVLGEEHPETILNRLLMANIRRRQGRLDEAETLCIQALAQLERIFGMEHPRAVTCRLLLVEIWLGQGQELRAVECFEWCVELRRTILPEHPNTIGMAQRLEEWKRTYRVSGKGREQGS